MYVTGGGAGIEIEDEDVYRESRLLFVQQPLALHRLSLFDQPPSRDLLLDICASIDSRSSVSILLRQRVSRSEVHRDHGARTT